jgi:hypothetical protein
MRSRACSAAHRVSETAGKFDPSHRPPRAPANPPPAPPQAVEDCGLMLWAAELELSHPLDGRPLRFAEPPPPKYHAFLAREAARWRKFHEPPTYTELTPPAPGPS